MRDEIPLLRRGVQLSAAEWSGEMEFDSPPTKPKFLRPDRQIGWLFFAWFSSMARTQAMAEAMRQGLVK